MRDSIILLKALRLSTSQLNIFKYTDDKKKKSRIIGNVIGLFILFAMLMAFCISMSIGYGKIGISYAIPVLSALVISGMAFVLTLFKTNGYLFAFREYDMLMSLPFKAKTVAGCKFLSMYIDSIPWFMSISIAMMIGYGIYESAAIWVYPLWIVLSIVLPIIPMLIASFIGFIIARISAGFKKTNIVQVILTIIFILFIFSLRFIIEDLIRNNKVEATLYKASQITDDIAGYYLPAKWFVSAVRDGNLLSILLLVVVSVILFVLLFSIVGRSYIRINSALKSHASSKKYKMTSQKSRSVISAIAFKEYRRMIGSPNYLINAGMGIILSLIVSLIFLILGMDWVIDKVMKGAPLDAASLTPAIPFIVFLFTGMIATTAWTPSLEGKNIWIIRSLPLEMKKVYQGKMLFNVLLFAPTTAVSIILMCISARASILDSVLYVILGISLVAYSTCWGCVCGIKHMTFDWENDVDVIKKGTATLIYMLPNMIVVMGLIALSVFLGMRMSHVLLSLIMIVIALVLALLSYVRVMKLAKKEGIGND